MTRNNHNVPATAHVVRHSLALLLAGFVLLCAPAARALDTGDIVITSVKGEVHVVMQGAERAVKAGTVLETPATVRTGHDGALGLRQGATSVSVGPDTVLEFPELATRGGPIDRIVQPRGNAFYDIGKRPGRKLRVETPWLVGVVKGTQFNVAVQEDGATISLFEGLLEIRASDETSTVDIKAGEIATRRRGDRNIGVLKMDAGKAPAPRPPTGATDKGHAGGASPREPRLASSADDPALAVPANRNDDLGPVSGPRDLPAAGTLMDGIGDAVSEVAGEAGIEGRAPAGIAASVDVATGTGLDVGADAAAVGGTVSASVDVASAGTNVDAGVSAGVDVGGAASVDVNAGSAVEVGATGVAANVDLGTSAGIGNATAVDANAGAAVDVGGSGVAVNVDVGASAGLGNVASVDTGIGAGVDLGNTNAGAAVDVNAGANAGPLSTGAGAGVAVDLGDSGTAATVDLGASTGVGGVAAVDAGVGAAVNVGPTADVAANVDLGADVAGVNAGVSAAADLGSGNVDLGVNVAGVNLNVGLDLGLGGQDDPGQDTANTGGPGNTNSGPGSDNSNPGNVVTDVVNDVVDDVGGLLNGLLKKPKRR